MKKCQKLSPIAKRIKDAIIADPIWDLAMELFNEGFNEESLSLYFKEIIIEDPKRIKLLNYMRDIKNGAKKPLR